MRSNKLAAVKSTSQTPTVHQLEQRPFMNTTRPFPRSNLQPGLTRRRFLTASLAGAAVLPLVQVRPAGARRRIKLGVIGCGGRGLWIARLFRAHGGYDLWSVADYFPAVAEAAGEELGVEDSRRFSGLSGYQQLIESGVEAVALETPPYFFPEHTAAAVAAGKQIFLAKPVAVDVPGCRSIEASAEKARRAGLVFLVDYQMPTDPHNQEVVQRIRDGGIGELQLIDSQYYAGTFADPPREETIASRLQRLIWVNDVAVGGGYHVNACIHAIDAALWLADQCPVSAFGLSRRGRPAPHGDSHDVFALLFEFEDQLIWNHRGKHLNNQTGFDVVCQAQGERGHAQLGYGGQALLRSNDDAYRGEVANLYEAGAVRNIARFHDCVSRGNIENETVRRSIDGALITILGREAARRRTRLTLAQLLAENERLEVDLSGLRL
jgi:myo-inositol 2-dehydrogenase / D-chiro-inositol 1-dehydrogenase